jgi:hypothetical protein
MISLRIERRLRTVNVDRLAVDRALHLLDHESREAAGWSDLIVGVRDEPGRREACAKIVLSRRCDALSNVDPDRDVDLPSEGDVVEGDRDRLVRRIHDHVVERVRGAVVEQVADLAIENVAAPRRRELAALRHKGHRQVVGRDQIKDVRGRRNRDLDGGLRELNCTYDGRDRLTDRTRDGNGIQDRRFREIPDDRLRDCGEHLADARLKEHLQEIRREGSERLDEARLIGNARGKRRERAAAAPPPMLTISLVVFSKSSACRPP